MSEIDDFPLRKYLEAVDAQDFERIVPLFSEDATYIRPSAPGPNSPQLGKLDVVKGRAEIKAYFDRRGPLALRHRIDAYAIEGNHHFLYVTVVVPDVPNISNMVSLIHAIYNDEGLITWYMGLVDVVTPEQAKYIEAARTA